MEGREGKEETDDGKGRKREGEGESGRGERVEKGEKLGQLDLDICPGTPELRH